MDQFSLLMKYHPAKKEVEFFRCENGNSYSISNKSKLKQYENSKGKFVLQDHGIEFFDNIVMAFGGLPNVDIKIITTRNDFEDFQQMVEYYNDQSKNCKITASLIAELPSMEESFAIVKEYGKESIGILASHKLKINDYAKAHPEIKLNAFGFIDKIDSEIRSVEEKIYILRDNNVNLCFAGVYSAGKSALINALLGFRILPESIESKTAKMIRIISPEKGDPVAIEFDIVGKETEIVWKDEYASFEFVFGPVDNDIRTGIQQKLNELRQNNYKQFEQIYSILSYLNEEVCVSQIITVKFPIPMDNERIRFTIFDTPGTDSNFNTHQAILKDALSNQAQSILIFVVHPAKFEGEGNNALLSYLKEVTEKNNRTSIDISRSLFVINHSDDISAEQRSDILDNEIKSKDAADLSIKLADKKVFFTSAKYGYLARAAKNSILQKEEEFDYKVGSQFMTNDASPKKKCYQQNKCATSELATDQMLSLSEEALQNAIEMGDQNEVLYVCSGLFSLENEMIKYGDKFASAVKTFSIIECVDKALKVLTQKADSLLSENKQTMESLKNEIAEAKKSIRSAIDKTTEKYAIKNNEIPESDRKRLLLDSDSICHIIINPLKEQINPIFTRKFLWWSNNRVSVKEEHKEIIQSKVNGLFADYVKSFLKKRDALLTDKRDKIVDEVKQDISENNNLSPEARDYIGDIPDSDITQGNYENIQNIYDRCIRTGKWLFFTSKYLDKNALFDDLTKQLLKKATELADQFSKDYSDTLNTILANATNDFTINVEKYSLDMSAKIQNYNSMKGLGEIIKDASKELHIRREKLEDILWRRIGNA